MARPESIRKARHLFAESRGGMIGDARNAIRNLNQNLSASLNDHVESLDATDAMRTLQQQTEQIWQTVQERVEEPSAQQIEQLADQLDILEDTLQTPGLQAYGKFSEHVEEFRNTWAGLEFEQAEEVDYQPSSQPQVQPQPEAGPQENAPAQPSNWDEYIKAQTGKDVPDEEALPRLARAMAGVTLKSQGKPFNAQEAEKAAQQIQNSQAFKDTFEIEDYGIPGMPTSSDLARDYLFNGDIAAAIGKMNPDLQIDQEGQKGQKEPEVITTEAGRRSNSDSKETSFAFLSDDDSDAEMIYKGNIDKATFKDFVPSGADDAVISRRGLIGYGQQYGPAFMLSAELAGIILGGPGGDPLDQVSQPAAVALADQIHRLIKDGALTAADKRAEIEKRVSDPTAIGAAARQGRTEVIALRLLDRIQMPEGVNKARLKNQLKQHIKSKPMDYREYFELNSDPSKAGNRLNEPNKWTYEHKASTKEFALFTAAYRCMKGDGTEKPENRDAFSAEVQAMKNDSFAATMMKNKRVCEALQKGDIDRIYTAVQKGVEMLTFDKEELKAQAEADAARVLDAMKKQGGTVTQSREWTELMAAVEKCSKDASCENNADVLVKVEKFTKGKKNFQKDPAKQACVNLALDALKTCVPNAADNPCVTPLTDRFTKVRGRNNAVDLNQYGVNSQRSNILCRNFADTRKLLEKNIDKEEQKYADFLHEAYDQMKEYNIAPQEKLRAKGKVQLLDAMYKDAGKNSNWRMTPEKEKAFGDAVKIADQYDCLASMMNGDDAVLARDAANFTKMLQENKGDEHLMRGFTNLIHKDAQNGQESEHVKRMVQSYGLAVRNGQQEAVDTLKTVLRMEGGLKQPQKGAAPQL